jgi:HK97 family phage major capsid protein
MRSLTQYREEIAAKTKEIVPLAERAAKGELGGDDLVTFRELKGEIETLHGEMRDAEGLDADAKQMLELARQSSQPDGRRISGQVPREREEQRESETGEEAPRYRSLGEAFAHSEALNEYRQRVGQGTSSRAFRVGSTLREHRDEAANAKGVSPEVRNVVNNTGLGSVVEKDRLPVYVTPDRQQLTVRDLFASGTTDGGTVEFVKEGAITNNAAEVAEAIDLTTGLKPESALALSVDTAPVRTIAHIIYATRQALDDYGQLRMLIDQFLLRGLDERIDRQLLLGNGVAPNITGVLAASGVQVLNAAYWTANPLPTAGAAANDWDRLRRAVRLVRTVGRGTATGIVLSPMDIERAELIKTTTGEYLYPGGGPAGGGVFTMWRLPVVENENLTEGRAVVGDFARGAAVLDRMQGQIFATDSNRDLFERNIITILAETRIAFPIYAPSRFTDVTLR